MGDRGGAFVCVTGDGFPLQVRTAGPATAPTVLLLQGQGNSQLWWNQLRTAFQCDHRTVTFDYRGTGRSRGPIDSWSTQSFADDAVSVLNACGVDSAFVYATSMGGRVAQLIAAHHPARMRALVLACTTAGGPQSVDRDPSVSRSLMNTPPAERQRVLHELFFTPNCPPSVETAALLGDPSMTAQEAAAHRRASKQHDAWQLLPSITAPTLVLHGEQDRMTPVENGVQLAHRIPGARLKTYPGLRHGFFAERADEVSRDVSEFFAAQNLG